MNIEPKKYAIHPGVVTSVNDGQQHWLTCNKVISAYGLLKADCVCVGEAGWKRWTGDIMKLVHLYPRSQGDYAEHLEYAQRQKRLSDVRAQA